MHRLAISWLVVLCGMGCGKNVVKPKEVSRASAARPSVVLVYDPTFRDADVTENKSTVALVADPGSGQDERTEVGRQVAAAFAAEMVEDINKTGIRAERAVRATPVPPNALIVVGQFVDVDEGNRVKRLVIGFGDGASRLDARIQVYETGAKLLAFETHADSGKMPGGAATLGAGAMVTGGVTAASAVGGVVTGGVKAHLSAIEKLAAKSGAQASAYLSEYFGKQGWIAADRVKQAKE